jgi:hypothetical protein
MKNINENQRKMTYQKRKLIKWVTKTNPKKMCNVSKKEDETIKWATKTKN